MDRASPLATFLDVTAPSAPAGYHETVTRAKVLLAVSEEWELASEVANRADLPLAEAFEVFAWLAQNQLVDMTKEFGGIRLRLTALAAVGLEAA